MRNTELLFFGMHCGQQLTWAKDVLLGSEVSWQQLDHMPAQGLFFERNKTNFFNGIWRIPVDEVDRPGSFASHMSRSVMLLLDVLPSLGEVGTLLRLSSTLHRTPDQGKKFLRDLDRQQLAQKAFGLGVQVLETQLRALCQDREHPTNKDAMALTPPVTVVAEGPCVAVSSRLEGGAQGLLVEAFRAWQQGQRMAGTHDLGRLEKIMVASLGLLGEQETSVEHAIRFCQQLLAAPTQRQPISDAPKRETSATTPPFASRIVPQIPHPSSTQMPSGPLLLASDVATKPPRSPTGPNLHLSHSPRPASSPSVSDAACSRSFTSPVNLPEVRSSTHQSDASPIGSPAIAHEPRPVSEDTKNKLKAVMLSNRWPATSSSPPFQSPSANPSHSPLPCHELPTGLAPETLQEGGSEQVKGTGQGQSL
uniref:Uncharacterized protein n=1 Tax=Eptatretus burgeri TaxID=7764 RepID=A0A8C4NIJ8_EPTBU